ncbi:DUF3304 domain-containing protein [Providencia manganoxydans]|uniref:DUF3304 domain-containing protein n=1 Tax=Providencia manganoxydans TaxID=2923283 RepID=UPI003D7EA6D3
MLPEKWRPNLIVHIQWKKVDTTKFPPAPKFSQVEAYNRCEHHTTDRAANTAVTFIN